MDEVVFPLREAVKFTGGSQGVTLSGAVDLYGAPYAEAPPLVSVAAGTSFASLGVAGDWHKLDLGKGQVAFARADDLELGAKTPRRPGKSERVYAVSPPTVKLDPIPGQTAKTSVTISGSAVDDRRVRDVYVTVFNPARDLFGNPEKVHYVASQDPSSGQLSFSAEVPLTPGNNIIEIVARENGQVSGRERMWVLRTSGLAEARAAEADFQSNGKLSVDTFN